MEHSGAGLNRERLIRIAFLKQGEGPAAAQAAQPGRRL